MRACIRCPDLAAATAGSQIGDQIGDAAEEPAQPIPPSPYALSGTVPGPRVAPGGMAGVDAAQAQPEGDGEVDEDGKQAGPRQESPKLAERLTAKVPPAARGGVVDPGRRAVGALALVGVLAASVAGGYLWRSRPEPVPIAPREVVATVAPRGSPAGASTLPSATAAPLVRPSASPVTATSEVVVDVGGKVSDPGVYTLPSGSRVVDAVKAAGGADHGVDLTGLNLARLLVDGEKILVGVRRPPGLIGPPGGVPPMASASPGTGAVLDLNVATAEQLQELPGIGPVLSERIVEYRIEHGGFGSIAELKDVSGIGEATFADLEDKVRV